MPKFSCREKENSSKFFSENVFPSKLTSWVVFFCKVSIFASLHKQTCKINYSKMMRRFGPKKTRGFWKNHPSIYIWTTSFLKKDSFRTERAKKYSHFLKWKVKKFLHSNYSFFVHPLFLVVFRPQIAGFFLSSIFFQHEFSWLGQPKNALLQFCKASTERNFFFPPYRRKFPVKVNICPPHFTIFFALKVALQVTISISR